MTTKMRLIFVMAAAGFAVFFVSMSTQYAANITEQVLSTVANALDLHEMPKLSALAVLAIPILYLAFRPRRRS